MHRWKARAPLFPTVRQACSSVKIRANRSIDWAKPFALSWHWVGTGSSRCQDELARDGGSGATDRLDAGSEAGPALHLACVHLVERSRACGCRACACASPVPTESLFAFDAAEAFETGYDGSMPAAMAGGTTHEMSSMTMTSQEARAMDFTPDVLKMMRNPAVWTPAKQRALLACFRARVCHDWAKERRHLVALSLKQRQHNNYLKAQVRHVGSGRPATPPRGAPAAGAPTHAQGAVCSHGLPAGRPCAAGIQHWARPGRTRAQTTSARAGAHHAQEQGQEGHGDPRQPAGQPPARTMRRGVRVRHARGHRRQGGAQQESHAVPDPALQALCSQRQRRQRDRGRDSR